MFRKLISNITFSPALVGQLGFYAKRLKKEESTRRIGLIFTALALVVQSFAVFSPPESANAASSQDLVYGGVRSIDDFLAHYDRNENNLRDIFNAAGVTRQEIASTHSESFNSKNVRYSVGRNPRFSAAQGEVAFPFDKQGGGGGTVYISPNRLWDTLPYTKANGSSYQAFVGYSAKLGWFAIMKDCGNLAMQVIPSPPPPPPPAVCPPGMIGTPPNCTIPVKPSSACTDLAIAPISRTEVELRGKAAAESGATINSYVYTVKDSAGKQVFTKTIQSSEKASTTKADLEKPGNYTATLVVKTSIGDRAGANCAKPLTINNPEKCVLNPDLTKEDENCKPCPENPSVWVKDKRCKEQVVLSKTAKNMTQDTDATKVTAEASDKISYTVTMKNVGLLPGKIAPEEDLADVLEYAQLVDGAGATFDKKDKTLTWPEMEIAPGKEESRTFVVTVASTIPSTARGVSNRSSYDCIMSNTFGNAVTIDVDCQGPKIVEQTVAELPHTGAGANMIFAGITLAVVVYFYARSRQLGTEVRLIRRDLNAGAL